MSTFDGDAMLDEIDPELPRLSTEICLKPSLLNRRKKIAAALEESQTARAKRLNPGGGRELAEAMQEIEAEIEKASVEFVFEAMPTDDYQALCAMHPPRDDNRFDFMNGFNTDAVNNELVRKCLISPTYSDKGWDRLRSKLAPSEWAEMRSTAVEANGGDQTTPPKSELASHVLSQLDSV